MVLWEITLGTAYFLGLKRTYRLGLRLQRKVISLKQPKTRQFVQRYLFSPLIALYLLLLLFVVILIRAVFEFNVII